MPLLFYPSSFSAFCLNLACTYSHSSFHLTKHKRANYYIPKEVRSQGVQVLGSSLPKYNCIHYQNVSRLDSGCGSVGRVVTSDTRGLRFEYSHVQNCIENISIFDSLE